LKLPVLSSREVCKFLEQEGFVPVRQKGSHRFYSHNDGRTTTVPIHPNKPVSRGLLKAILEEIKMDREEFLRKFYKRH